MTGLPVRWGGGEMGNFKKWGGGELIPLYGLWSIFWILLFKLDQSTDIKKIAH